MKSYFNLKLVEAVTQNNIRNTHFFGCKYSKTV